MGLALERSNGSWRLTITGDCSSEYALNMVPGESARQWTAHFRFCRNGTAWSQCRGSFRNALERATGAAPRQKSSTGAGPRKKPGSKLADNIKSPSISGTARRYSRYASISSPRERQPFILRTTVYHRCHRTVKVTQTNDSSPRHPPDRHSDIAEHFRRAQYGSQFTSRRTCKTLPKPSEWARHGHVTSPQCLRSYRDSA